MAKQLQLRKGTTVQHSTFTGAIAEVTVDTDKDTLIVHDGTTVGGHELAKKSQVDLKANNTDPTFYGTVTLPLTTNIGIVSGTELSYLDGTTSNLQTQINTKAPTANPTFTGTVSGITKSMVGLGSVDNTSDANKPISSATQTELNLKAPLDSPALTGNPTAPTASVGDNDTTIATTAFVNAEIAKDAVLKTSDIGAAMMPSGTTAERPTLGVNDRCIRYNTTLQSWESWNGVFWGSLGSGQMLGNSATKAISYNSQVIAENIVVPTGLNAYSVGDVTIENGYILTVENGSVYKIL